MLPVLTVFGTVRMTTFFELIEGFQNLIFVFHQTFFIEWQPSAL